MSENQFRDQKWEDVLGQLQAHKIPPKAIGTAIVRLGKPFDATRILAAKSTVASYLDHPDSWVRHEAMWFLTWWGGLKEYQPALIQALQSDSDPDNRSWAASCIGRLQEGTGDINAIKALKTVLDDEKEDELVRLYAYGSLLEVVRGSSGFVFSPHEQKLADVDWGWVRSLPKGAG